MDLQPAIGMKSNHGAEITEKTAVRNQNSVSSVSEPALSEAEGWCMISLT
jgi:hypothetical protein